MRGYHEPFGSIDRVLVEEVQNQIAVLGPIDRETSRIDVWLDSPGGDAHAAYKLALLLDAHFKTINFVILDYAKSAATLLALVGDAIFMGPCAELGPLDIQERREGEVGLRSALETAHAVEELIAHGVQAALQNGVAALMVTGLSRETTFAQVLRFVSAAMRPLLKQLDPGVVHQGPGPTAELGESSRAARGVGPRARRRRLEEANGRRAQ
ncbi:MAG: hypothetical protein LBG60_06945 [Bifidobacteriaceae bacterium]|jgi:membrane-bound ClpP family serine protease|nr:hypothetical protein [Bifidobacteriaceae bacterium]